MNEYINGNKAAWEEAFDLRSEDWGADILPRVENESYPFFNEETVRTLRKYNLTGKTIGQFCSNNGRELLSLVKSTGATQGIGFDIADNQVKFANECGRKLNLPCEFKSTNIYDINGFDEAFDFTFITIGALCWFKDLDRFFHIVAGTMKKGASIVINESHPMINMLALEGEDEYDPSHPLSCVYSYFEHEWLGNQGMYYITGRNYNSKTFTDYTHSLSEIMGAMCNNGIVVTNFEEYDHDIGVGYYALDGKRFPLSMIIEGRKL